MWGSPIVVDKYRLLRTGISSLPEREDQGDLRGGEYEE